MNFIKIINHFGYDNQIKKLAEEQYELIEALWQKDKEHVKEEMADNIVLIWQFAEKLGISVDEILDEVRKKHDRTLKRIEEGYYD